MKYHRYKVFLLVGAIVVSFLLMGITSTDSSIGKTDFVLTLKKPSNGFSSGQFIEAADPDWPFDIWISGGSYQSYSADRSEDTAMYGSFEIQTSAGLDFFICDQENYDLWTGGYTAYVYEISYNVGSLEWEFIVPYTDRWYKMYDNTDNLFYQAHVVGTHRLDITAPTIALNLDDGDICSQTEEIVASAIDEGFGVYTFSLYINNVLTDSVYASSLSYDWDTTRLSDGDYVIRLRAEDRTGLVSSVEIDVSVSNIPGLLIPAIIGGSAALVVAGVAILFVHKIKTQGTHPETVYYPSSPEPIGFQPKPEVVAFCPSCGSPRQPPNARFCGNCSAAFQN